jgi:hypothetical protein
MKGFSLGEIDKVTKDKTFVVTGPGAKRSSREISIS